MKRILACAMALLLASAASAQELRVQVVDADSGQPIANVKVVRWASQWQPRILLPPGKFWFSEGGATSNADGLATISKTARDDWYKLETEGYDGGTLKREWGQYKFVRMGQSVGTKPAEKSGIVVVPLKKKSDRSSN